MERSDLAKQSPPVALKNPEIFWDQAAMSLARNGTAATLTASTPIPVTSRFSRA
jgi:hypothetical protein